MSALPLSRDEFADALRKGKGRAAQHVRVHGDAGVEDLLLEACVHSLGHDPQSEGNRGDWLMMLLSSLADPTPYHRAVHAAFESSDNDHDVDQVASMLLHLAKSGSPEARQGLYDKFDRQEFASEWMLSEEIIALDGLVGLLHVARALGRRLMSDPDYWLSDHLLRLANEQMGAEVVDDALRGAAVKSVEVGRFHEAMAGAEESLRAAEPHYGLADFLRELDEGKRNARGIASRFGRGASTDELSALLELIEGESDPDRIAKMLAVFRLRADPPGGPTRILPFARSPAEAVRKAAITVLSKFTDDRLGELSVELLGAGKLEGLELLERNYIAGQYDQVRGLLPIAADDDAVHGIALDIISIGRSHLDVEAVDCLLWVYEESPCSFCRWSAVEDLIKLDRLPAQVATECLDDAMGETREAVAGLAGRS